MNTNNKEYKNHGKQLKALTKLHILVMNMLSTIATNTNFDDEHDKEILEAATNATSVVMAELVYVMIETDNNLTEEDIFEVFDYEWKKAVDEQSASYNIIGRNIDRMMGLS